jgi:hypothetical protein
MRALEDATIEIEGVLKTRDGHIRLLTTFDDDDTYLQFLSLFDLESAFVDPVRGKIALGLLAMTTTSAVQRLIAGVVERSLGGFDFRLAIRLGASRRIPEPRTAAL